MIYLYWYLGVTLVGLFPFFCWFTYLTSFSSKEYRYLRVGDILWCLVCGVVPGLNIFSVYAVVYEVFDRGFLNNFLNKVVFEGKAKK